MIGNGIDWPTLSALLAEKAEPLCAELLPEGRKNGGCWEVGSVRGESGSSLKVNLTGPKQGKWKDYDPSQGLYGDIWT